MTYVQSVKHIEQSQTPLRILGFQTITCTLKPQKGSMHSKTEQMETLKKKHISMNQ